MSQADFMKWVNYPIGPQMRAWLQLPDIEQATQEFGNQERVAFTKAVLDHAAKQPVTSIAVLEDLLDELVGMNFPLLALGLFDLCGKNFESPMSFRGLFSLAIAAMLSGDYSQSLKYNFLAHEASPEEPAPYVNIAQILIYQQNYAEAQKWLDAGFKAELNNFNLWQIQGELLFQMHSEAFLDQLRDKALGLGSWAGVSLASSQAGGMRIEEKFKFMKDLYDSGEDSLDFVVEYTALLGELERFQEIPPCLWKAERTHKGESLPWQLLYHGACAHAALQEKPQAMRYINMLRFDPSIPHGLHQELDQLDQQLQEQTMQN